MVTGNITKINLRNFLIEHSQFVRKENAEKHPNYGIKDCITPIARLKIQQ